MRVRVKVWIRVWLRARFMVGFSVRVMLRVRVTVRVRVRVKSRVKFRVRVRVRIKVRDRVTVRVRGVKRQRRIIRAHTEKSSTKSLTLFLASTMAFPFNKASTTSGDFEYCAAYVRGVLPNFNEHTRMGNGYMCGTPIILVLYT